jgi:hypothetical protein
MSRIVCNPDTHIPLLRSQIGYQESPRGSNRTKYCTWYGLIGPWCAIFDSWASYHSGNPLPRIRTSKGYAYVPDLVDYAKRFGQWRSRQSNYQAKPGDRVIFSFGGERADHIGTVTQWLGNDTVRSIEGNTNGSGSRTGGMVLEKTRRSGIIGYVSVDIPPRNINWAALRRMLAAKLREQYGACPNMTGGHGNKCEVVALQQSLNLVSGAGLKEDGVYGPTTVKAVYNFQLFMNRVGANIKDYPGAAMEGTRWWICMCLQNIRDGKA